MSVLFFMLVLAVDYIAYIFSLHSLTSFLAPEQMEELMQRLSRFSRSYLQDVNRNPRITMQMTVIIKSLTLAATSLLSILAVLPLISQYEFGHLPLFIGAVAISWLLYLFFLEYLPKRRTLQPVDRGIRKYIPLFALAYHSFRPFLSLYNSAFDNSRERVSEGQKEEIIERAIETLAEQAGMANPIIEEEEKEMIGQIFQLDITEVREVMVPRIDIIGFGKSVEISEIKKTTDEHGFSRYPVFDENLDKIIGILYIKDLFTGMPLSVDETGFDITKYLRRPHFVPESKKISDLLEEFKRDKVHIALVVDEYGGTSGLVTLEDILEEIVGDIQDEHDYEPAEMVHLPDNSILLDAGISVEELIDEFVLDYETEDFETVGGLIYDLVGSVPLPGARLQWRGIQFEVVKVEGQRIIEVRAKLAEKASTGDAMSD